MIYLTPPRFEDQLYRLIGLLKHAPTVTNPAELRDINEQVTDISAALKRAYSMMYADHVLTGEMPGGF